MRAAAAPTMNETAAMTSVLAKTAVSRRGHYGQDGVDRLGAVFGADLHGGQGCNQELGDGGGDRDPAS